MISLSISTLIIKEEDIQIGRMALTKAILKALENQLLTVYGELNSGSHISFLSKEFNISKGRSLPPFFWIKIMF